jgi:hypothetical protein
LPESLGAQVKPSKQWSLAAWPELSIPAARCSELRPSQEPISTSSPHPVICVDASQ